LPREFALPFGQFSQTGIEPPGSLEKKLIFWSVPKSIATHKLAASNFVLSAIAAIAAMLKRLVVYLDSYESIRTVTDPIQLCADRAPSFFPIVH
jgi:hypothetical protein